MKSKKQSKNELIVNVELIARPQFTSKGEGFITWKTPFCNVTVNMKGLENKEGIVPIVSLTSFPGFHNPARNQNLTRKISTRMALKDFMR